MHAMVRIAISGDVRFDNFKFYHFIAVAVAESFALMMNAVHTRQERHLSFEMPCY